MRVTRIQYPAVIAGVLLLVSFATRAQTNQQKAIKFDEFKYVPEDTTARANRFAQEFRKHPGAEAYVIVYGMRVHEPYQGDAETISMYVTGDLAWNIKDRISQNRIHKINGGLRDEAMVELYIVPRGAAPPVPSPAYRADQEVYCPHPAYLYTPSFVWRNDQIIEFRADFAESVSIHGLRWSVSSGTIISGQGTKTIKVRSEGLSYKSITATVELLGLPSECRTTTSEHSPEQIATLPLKVADLIGNCEVDLAYLEYHTAPLLERPDLTAYLIFYGGKIPYLKYPPRRGETESLAKAKLDHIIFGQRFDPARFTMIDGGFREKWAMELWLVEKDGAVPVPTPTIRPADVKFGNGPIRLGAKSDCGGL